MIGALCPILYKPFNLITVKKIISLFLLLPFLSNAQVKSYNTFKEAKAVINSGKYKSSIGWELQENQELTLGRGSMPDKTFAFITEVMLFTITM
jgi:hypothetical protein